MKLSNNFLSDKPSEKSVAFRLGYLLEQEGSDCYGRLKFLVGKDFKSDKIIVFSPPDLDLLEMGEELRVFEVKGYRKSNNGKKLGSGQVLKGVGQAMSNLVWEVDEGDESRYYGFVDKSFVVVPNNNEPWMKKITKSLRSSPIGMIEVSNDGIDVISEAKENPHLDKKKQRWFLDRVDFKSSKGYFNKYADYTLWL